MLIKTSEQEELLLGIGDYSCNWGTHICGLYETDSERDEIINNFLTAGINAGDFQLYIHSEQTKETFSKGFLNHCPKCFSEFENPATFEIKNAKDLYYPNGVFDPWYMDTAVNGYYDYIQNEKKKKLRAIAEMYWALELIPGVENLFAYESRLNYFVRDKNVISICLYNISKISGEMLMNVLRTHPYTISKKVIIQNPYFVDPDQWLAQYAPQYLRR